MFNKNKRARSLEENLTRCVYIFNPFCPEHVQKLLQLQILPKRMEQKYPAKIIETRDHVLFFFLGGLYNIIRGWAVPKISRVCRRSWFLPSLVDLVTSFGARGLGKFDVSKSGVCLIPPKIELFNREDCD